LTLTRYIEQHLTIYNTNRLNEKYVVSLRLALGQRTEFSSMPGMKSTYSYLFFLSSLPLSALFSIVLFYFLCLTLVSYRTLEKAIIKFMRQFRKFWFNALSTSASTSTPSSSTSISPSTSQPTSPRSLTHSGGSVGNGGASVSSGGNEGAHSVWSDSLVLPYFPNPVNPLTSIRIFFIF
jgi:hypothetical protein